LRKWKTLAAPTTLTIMTATINPDVLLDAVQDLRQDIEDLGHDCDRDLLRDIGDLVLDQDPGQGRDLLIIDNLRIQVHQVQGKVQEKIQKIGPHRKDFSMGTVIATDLWKFHNLSTSKKKL
jgi:hypothetical protein